MKDAHEKRGAQAQNDPPGTVDDDQNLFGKFRWASEVPPGYDKSKDVPAAVLKEAKEAGRLSDEGGVANVQGKFYGFVAAEALEEDKKDKDQGNTEA